MHLVFACLFIARPFFSTPTAAAQTAFASVAGEVVDPTGSALPRADILLRNTDLGTTRHLLSGPHGFFRADTLAPGTYTVEARGAGLATRRALRLTLSAGSSQRLRLRAEPLATAQSTRVTGRASTVEGNTTAPVPNTAEASLGVLLPGLTVTYLPSRNRQLAAFGSLSANSVDDDAGTGLHLDGQRADELLTSLDGTDVTSPLFGGNRDALDRAPLLPLTAVREFEIVRSGLDSTSGRTTSGLLNIVTKGGANRRRGEAFYTGQPPAFSSADAFDHSVPSSASLFGAAYGGPLRRDRVFGFASLEQQLVSVPLYAAFDPQAAGLVVPAGLAAAQGEIVTQQSPLLGFGRLDWSVNAVHTVTAEFAFARVRSSHVDTSFAGLARSAATADHTSSLGGQSFTTRLSLTSLLSPRAINNIVVAWSSDHRQLTPDATTPEEVINGFGVLGGTSDGAHRFTTARTQVADDLTLSRDQNALTLGANTSIEPSYEFEERNTNGRFDYDSLPDFLAARPRRFQQTFLTGDTRYRGTVGQLGLYANARVAIRRSLFLTAGLRWDAQWNPQPSSVLAGVPVRVPNDLQQWQPRGALAWDARPDTTVRVSAGLFAAPTPATFFHRVFADSGTQTITADSDFDPTLLQLTGATAGTPRALAAPPPGLTTPHAAVVGIAPDFRNPMSFGAAASIDHRFSAKIGVTAVYTRAATWALERRLDQNLNAPTLAMDGTPVFPAQRPNPALGRVLVEQSTAHSTYDAASISMDAPFSRRSQLQLQYTWAHARDDDSGGGPFRPDTALDPFDLRLERADANFDVRQSVNLNAIVNLPAGFKINPLLQARSGLPYTAIVGFDQQNDANDRNDRAVLNGLVAPRNSLRQPAFSDLDLRLVKDFTLRGEGHHLDLFLDAFNLVGAHNLRFAPDAQDLFGNATHPVFSAGQALFAPGAGRAGGPRTFQLTARLVGF